MIVTRVDLSQVSNAHQLADFVRKTVTQEQAREAIRLALVDGARGSIDLNVRKDGNASVLPTSVWDNYRGLSGKEALDLIEGIVRTPTRTKKPACARHGNDGANHKLIPENKRVNGLLYLDHDPKEESLSAAAIRSALASLGIESLCTPSKSSKADNFHTFVPLATPLDRDVELGGFAIANENWRLASMIFGSLLAVAAGCTEGTFDPAAVNSHQLIWFGQELLHKDTSEREPIQRVEGKKLDLDLLMRSVGLGSVRALKAQTAHGTKRARIKPGRTHKPIKGQPHLGLLRPELNHLKQRHFKGQGHALRLSLSGSLRRAGRAIVGGQLSYTDEARLLEVLTQPSDKEDHKLVAKSVKPDDSLGRKFWYLNNGLAYEAARIAVYVAQCAAQKAWKEGVPFEGNALRPHVIYSEFGFYAYNMQNLDDKSRNMVKRKLGTMVMRSRTKKGQAGAHNAAECGDYTCSSYWQSMDESRWTKTMNLCRSRLCPSCASKANYWHAKASEDTIYDGVHYAFMFDKDRHGKPITSENMESVRTRLRTTVLKNVAAGTYLIAALPNKDLSYQLYVFIAHSDHGTEWQQSDEAARAYIGKRGPQYVQATCLAGSFLAHTLAWDAVDKQDGDIYDLRMEQLGGRQFVFQGREFDPSRYSLPATPTRCPSAEDVKDAKRFDAEQRRIVGRTREGAVIRKEDEFVFAAVRCDYTPHYVIWRSRHTGAVIYEGPRRPTKAEFSFGVTTTGHSTPEERQAKRAAIVAAQGVVIEQPPDPRWSLRADRWHRFRRTGDLIPAPGLQLVPG